jgi:hypothetical protein
MCRLLPAQQSYFETGTLKSPVITRLKLASWGQYPPGPSFSCPLRLS